LDQIRGVRQRALDLIASSEVPADEQSPDVATFVHPDFKIKTVGLMEHYSASAIYILDKILDEQEKPNSIIVEGMGNATPEVQYLMERAQAMGIDVEDAICTPYNFVIADLAGVSHRDAICALMVAELLRYKDNIGLLVNAISRLFNVSIASVEILSVMIVQNLETEKRKARVTFEKLLTVSNDISWYLVKNLELKGNVLAMVGGSHTKIFDPQFKPSKSYSEEELLNIRSRIVLLTASSPDTSNARMTEVLVDVDFFKKWDELKEELSLDPNNDLLKQRLKRLLLPDYQRLMDEGLYFYARQRATSMLKYGVEGAEALLKAARDV